MEGFDRYADNVTLDDSQALELVYLLRQHHGRWIRVANLCGGHLWSKQVLLQALKSLVPMPLLQTLCLPIEGLSEESVARCAQFKSAGLGPHGFPSSDPSAAALAASGPGGVRFRYKLEKCGAEFREIHSAAVHYHALRRDDFDNRVASSLTREGIKLQFGVSFYSLIFLVEQVMSS